MFGWTGHGVLWVLTLGRWKAAGDWGPYWNRVAGCVFWLAVLVGGALYFGWS